MINKKRLSILLVFSIVSSLLMQNVYADADDASYTFNTLYAAEEMYVNADDGDAVDIGWESWIGTDKVAHCIKYDISGAVNIPTDAITSVTVNLQTADRSELDNETFNKVTFYLYSMGTNWEQGQTYNTLNNAGVFKNPVLAGETLVEGNYRNRSFDIDITDYYKTLITEKADKAAFKLTANNSVMMKRRNDNTTYGPLTIKLSTEWMNNLVSGMTLKSGTAVIENLSDRTGNKVTASAIVNNNSCADSKKLILMIGLYENTASYSRLVDIKTVSKSLSMGQSVSLEKEFTLEENKNYNIVCNVWDSLTDLNTLFEQAVK